MDLDRNILLMGIVILVSILIVCLRAMGSIVGLMGVCIEEISSRG